jgi:hypothetical protein
MGRSSDSGENAASGYKQHSAHPTERRLRPGLSWDGSANAARPLWRRPLADVRTPSWLSQFPTVEEHRFVRTGGPDSGELRDAGARPEWTLLCRSDGVSGFLFLLPPAVTVMLLT